MLRIILPVLGKWKLLKYVIWGLMGGLLSFLVIHLITKMMRLITSGVYTKVSEEYLLLFATALLLFVWVRRTLALSTIYSSQGIFWDLRRQLMKSILDMDYEQLSNKRSHIQSAIVSDIQTLTDASISIISFSTSLLISVTCLFYLALISWKVLIITLSTTLLGIVIYQISSKKNAQYFKIARNLEINFVNHFDSILNGFREITLEPKKGKSIVERRIETIAKQAYGNNVQAFSGFINNQIIGQVLFYGLIAAILLYFNVVWNMSTTDSISVVFTLLYLLNSIETIMVLLPNLVRANVAADNLVALRKELGETQNILPSFYERVAKNSFSSITVNSLFYKYNEDSNSAFGIGPINFKINQGETIFIYGGNGSGKTTFIHTFLRLLTPTMGEIRINDVIVTECNCTMYRTAFAVVFSDFYLYDELHAIDEINERKWKYYLKLFELEGKVILQNKCFSTTNLSTGQRKRLALISALLEEKPILVLDEWAADQDPYFRKKFYTEIIPILKKDGIAVLAITHDDKYYYCADRLYKMDYGKLVKEDIIAH